MSFFFLSQMDGREFQIASDMNYFYHFPQRTNTSNNIKRSDSWCSAVERPCHERVCSDATSRMAPELISPLTKFLLQVRRCWPCSSATSAVVCLASCHNLPYRGGHIVQRRPSDWLLGNVIRNASVKQEDGVRQLVPVRLVRYESVHEGKDDDSLVTLMLTAIPNTLIQFIFIDSD